MDISLTLAKFWGWYLLIFFFVLSFNPVRIKQIFEDLKDQKFLILASFLAIIIGLINTILHNIWASDWRIIITLMGWLAIFVGLALFVIPKQAVKWLEYINVKLVQVLYVLLFLIGLFLLNIAYQVVPY